MIFHRIIWATDKNIGRKYNLEMSLLPADDDFGLFIDGDAMMGVHPHFGRQPEDVVAKYPECGCFTAMTNRIGAGIQFYQIPEGVDWNNNDMAYHVQKAKEIAEQNYSICEDITDRRHTPMGGVLIMLRKSTWKKIGGFKDGLLGVDNQLHYSCIEHGEKVYLMKGVYLYHWYRGGDITNKGHLK